MVSWRRFDWSHFVVQAGIVFWQADWEGVSSPKLFWFHRWKPHWRYALLLDKLAYALWDHTNNQFNRWWYNRLVSITLLAVSHLKVIFEAEFASAILRVALKPTFSPFLKPGYPGSWFFMGPHILTQQEGICMKINILFKIFMEAGFVCLSFGPDFPPLNHG